MTIIVVPQSKAWLRTRCSCGAVLDYQTCDVHMVMSMTTAPSASLGSAVNATVGAEPAITCPKCKGIVKLPQ